MLTILIGLVPDCKVFVPFDFKAWLLLLFVAKVKGMQKCFPFLSWTENLDLLDCPKDIFLIFNLQIYLLELEQCAPVHQKGKPTAQRDPIQAKLLKLVVNPATSIAPEAYQPPSQVSNSLLTT